MVTITKNESYNSFELLFDGKPSQAIRDILKANGYKWHSVRKIWFGYKDITEALNKAIKGDNAVKKANTETTEEKEAKEKDKAEQNALREEYEARIKTVYTKSADMVEYCLKKAERLYKTETGQILSIEKPTIETRFCFGYGQNGISTDEEENNTKEMENYAETNESYFISENLKGIEEYIKALKDETETIKIRDTYHNGDGIATIEFISIYHPVYTNMQYYEVSEADRQGIIKAYETVKANFEKRLHAYLKRYGLSKIKAWTYLSD